MKRFTHQTILKSGLFILLVVSSATASRRGDCLYTSWMGVFSCFGPNVTEFPRVDASTRHAVGHIDIIQTNISELPTFSLDEWTNLFTMDIRDNPFLDCDNVFFLRDSIPDVLVVSDCLHQRERSLPKNHLLFLFILLPLCIAAFTSTLLGRKKCKNNRLMPDEYLTKEVERPNFASSIV
jgi:hypothetical protein